MNGKVVRGALWANDLTRLRPAEASRGEYAIGEVGALGQVPHLARAMAVDELVVRGRLERGCRAFAAWSGRDHAIVAWLWVSTGEEYAPPIRRTLQLAKADCYSWDAGTIEQHRGRGLFTCLLEFAGWRMAEKGCRTMWGGILDANLASQRATARAGFRPVLRLIAVHEPPGRLRTWAADYADERLVVRARGMLRARHVSSSTTADGGRRRSSRAA